MNRRLASSITAAALVAGLSTATLANPAVTGADRMVDATQAQVTDRIVIKYKTESKSRTTLQQTDLGKIQARAMSAGYLAHFVRKTATEAHVLKFDRHMSIDVMKKLADELVENDNTIEYAEPDYIAHGAQATANDPLFSDQWALGDLGAGTGATYAWYNSMGYGVTVAVVDSGYLPHADLAPNVVQGYDFISDVFRANDGDGRDSDARDSGNWRSENQCNDPFQANAQDSDWHGTAMAGIIAAKMSNNIFLTGMAPGAKILPIRATGTCGGYSSDIADGIIWAAGGAVPERQQTRIPPKLLICRLHQGRTVRTASCRPLFRHAAEALSL